MIRARTSTSSARRSGLSRVSGLAGCRVGRKFRESCTGALRADRLLMVGARAGRAPQQTVDDGAQLHQVRNRPQPGGRNLRGAGSSRCLFALSKISPIGRNQHGIGVRWREKKMQAAIPLPPTKYGDWLSFKGMASPNDGYLFWKGLVMGSLSIDPSTISITAPCSIFYARRLTTNGSSVLSREC